MNTIMFLYFLGVKPLCACLFDYPFVFVCPFFRYYGHFVIVGFRQSLRTCRKNEPVISFITFILVLWRQYRNWHVQKCIMINIMSMMNCCIYCFSSVSPLPNYWVAHRKLKDRQAFIGDFFKSLEKLSDLEKVAYATVYSSFTRINQINFLKSLLMLMIQVNV